MLCSKHQDLHEKLKHTKDRIAIYFLHFYKSVWVTANKVTFAFKLQEYENLAAQLDGARKDLSEKLKSQSLSASKEPLVVRAEEHANFLQDLARKLDEYVFIFADE